MPVNSLNSMNTYPSFMATAMQQQPLYINEFYEKSPIPDFFQKAARPATVAVDPHLAPFYHSGNVAYISLIKNSFKKRTTFWYWYSTTHSNRLTSSVQPTYWLRFVRIWIPNQRFLRKSIEFAAYSVTNAIAVNHTYAKPKLSIRIQWASSSPKLHVIAMELWVAGVGGNGKGEREMGLINES